MSLLVPTDTEVSEGVFFGLTSDPRHVEGRTPLRVPEETHSSRDVVRTGVCGDDGKRTLPQGNNKVHWSVGPLDQTVKRIVCNLNKNLHDNSERTPRRQENSQGRTTSVGP